MMTMLVDMLMVERKTNMLLNRRRERRRTRARTNEDQPATTTASNKRSPPLWISSKIMMKNSTTRIARFSLFLFNMFLLFTTAYNSANFLQLLTSTGLFPPIVLGYENIPTGL